MCPKQNKILYIKYVHQLKTRKSIDILRVDIPTSKTCNRQYRIFYCSLYPSASSSDSQRLYSGDRCDLLRFSKALRVVLGTPFAFLIPPGFLRFDNIFFLFEVAESRIVSSAFWTRSIIVVNQPPTSAARRWSGNLLKIWFQLSNPCFLMVTRTFSASLAENP